MAEWLVQLRARIARWLIRVLDVDPPLDADDYMKMVRTQALPGSHEEDDR